MKPVVYYSGQPEHTCIKVGFQAHIMLAGDHYAGYGMVAGELVTTSTVQSYDEATGVFETRNTIYKPKEI